ncbi:hypothetical protein PHPALM_12098 [Phytophthora palmivora]|uniref:Uncharacterized protein n=1 Tax=Phytophthora palmivora TaxID=4796 RepID=A0A2P4Y0T9_9STRA|nr:hypothetical protein PHPALM_12098 [Phytophthora palmivora]
MTRQIKKPERPCSRSQTTTRTLPDGADAICLEFIDTEQRIIDQHRIQSCSIKSMDQVPRNFETEPKKIYKHNQRITRGLALKRGTSHKWFTATFAITVDGKRLTPHLLFSKLKKKSKMKNCILLISGSIEMDEWHRRYEDFLEVVDDQYMNSLRDGEVSGGELEIFAEAHMHHCNIEVKTLNDDCRVVESFIYTVENPVKAVSLTRE